MITLEDFNKIQEDRIVLYRFIGRFFDSPLTQEDIDKLVEANIEDADCADESVTHGLHVMVRYLAKRNTGTREVLNRDYTAAFYGTQTVGGRVAMPYESSFEGAGQQLMGTTRSRVYNIMKKQAFKLQDGVDLPEDHLSFMCEFMAAMSTRSEGYMATNDVAGLSENLLLQEAFLKQHILSWYGDFKKLAEQIVLERFYIGVLEMAQGFLELDATTLGYLISRLGISQGSFDLDRWETPFAVKVSENDPLPAVDRNLCIRKTGGSCRECAAACPQRIDPCDDRGNRLLDSCTRCGACVKACPNGAISMKH